jgi:uncharacterized protein YndB with AHSA1/START domain
MRTRNFSIYIAAEQERVWRALTDPQLTSRYYGGLAVESDWCPGSTIEYRAANPAYPGHRLAGEIVWVEAGRLLAYSLLTDVDHDPEAQCWVTWELDAVEPSLCRVRLTCDDLDRDADPDRDEAWSRLLSALKTTVETAADRRAPGP